MIFITSPAKSLDFDSKIDPQIDTTEILFREEVKELTTNLKKLSLEKLKATLDISDTLAKLNYDRFNSWQTAPRKPAIFAYQGDIYKQFNAKSFSSADSKYIQENLRIISGLYGILRPFDLIKPYRLEMKTTISLFSNISASNLYDFWGDKLTSTLLDNLNQKGDADKYVVNLASQEYFKVLDLKQFKGKWIDIEFRQIKQGKEKNFGIYAKKGRGKFIKFAVDTKPNTLEDLQKFNLDGYKFREKVEEKGLIKLVFFKKI